MNNKGVGVVFCIISAALKITQYLTIAIYAQNRFTTSWSADDIEHYMSDYIGPSLPVWSTIALIAGIIFRERKPVTFGTSSAPESMQRKMRQDYDRFVIILCAIKEIGQ